MPDPTLYSYMYAAITAILYTIRKCFDGKKITYNEMTSYQRRRLTFTFKKYCYFLRNDLIHRGGEAEKEVV
jgi:hypothetical protein